MSVGIDVGSRFLKIAEMDAQGRISLPACVDHEGRPLPALEELYQKLGLHRHREIGITGGGAGALAATLGLTVTDLCKATIRGVRTRVPDARNILDIGASSVTLIEIDENGELQNISTNSVCAAGTGSFLDAQAARMGVKLEESGGFASIEAPPSIATRCAVFAKSDLIHRQQEGYGKEALWCGLCRGLSATLLHTLLKGKPLDGLTVVTGGVAKNREVLRWLETLAGSPIQSFPGAEFAAALGTASLAAENGSRGPLVFPVLGMGSTPSRNGPRRPTLELKRSDYPSFEVAEAWVDERGNEIRITRWPSSPVVDAYLGIDVGSTSTKALLVDEGGSVLVDIYRKTAGNPIGATKALFTALQEIARDRGTHIQVKGCGTTGSGRKLVGAVVGADLVLNEITAHLAGASATDPEVDTIFEIGGQDSKFIRAQGGVLRDANMNYVCAAGTGSFVEEQALKLGYPVDRVGDLVLEISPPYTSDRCTVFMEQDLERLVSQGFSPAEALAAVLYSVVENYLAKVVGSRSYSREKVFFCGATARNRGLVAAFEQKLGARVVVSPYCHVLGAFGVALLSREQMGQTRRPSRFKGLDLSRREVSLRQEECGLCSNACRITFAHIEGETEVPSWGYLCGRDPDSEEKRKTTEYDPFRLRGKLAARAFSAFRPKDGPGPEAPTVGLPMTLSTFSHGPMWQTFLANLGCRVHFSRPTDEATREEAGALVGSEYCFPAKLAHGHVGRLLKNPEVEWVFMPHTVSAPVPPEHANAFFCPVVCSLPAMARSALKVAGRSGAERILSPQVDLRWEEKRQVEELTRHLEGPLGVTRRQVRKAWEAARAAQASFETLCRQEGQQLLDRLEAEERTVILALGRAYNLFDGGANLELPLKIAEKGFTIVPVDLAPIQDVRLGEDLRNIYWVYGQILLRALTWARGRKNVFPVWFTNFKCGPDSFLLTYAERLIGDKPFLILELDEHGGDAGYLTRIEAFLEVVKKGNGRRQALPPLPGRTDPVDTFKGRTIWVPALHPISAPLAAAAMRGEGFDARSLPPEDAESMTLGRQVTRGGECIPMTVTMGRLLQTLRERGGDGSTDALFMPSAHGPCRFGQYNLLERLVLEREGFGNLAILAPDNDNAYQGLGEGLRRRIWTGTLIGDLVYKVGCRYRPYAKNPSRIDDLVDEATRVMEAAFENREALNPALRKALAPFRDIPRPPSNKPLVGVVGEIFVRCNHFSNQHVVAAIEANGGEAWLSPFHEWVLYACWEHQRRAKMGLDVLGKARSYLKNRYLFETEHTWYEEVEDLIGDRREPTVPESAEAAYPYASFNFGGEVLMTIGRTVRFFEAGAALVVNCSPFGCMPGQVTSGILNEVQRDWRRPVVSLFYDGTGDLNTVLGIFLRNLSNGRSAGAVPPA